MQTLPGSFSKALFRKGAWSYTNLKNGKIASVRVSIDDAVDPFDIFYQARNCWKFFWQSKPSVEVSGVTVGLGSLCYFDLNDADLEELGDLRVYGALSFPCTARGSDDWSEFGRTFFILPEIEWTFSPEGSVQVSVSFFRSDTDSSEDCCEKAFQLFGKYLAISGESALDGDHLPSVEEVSHQPGRSEWDRMVNGVIEGIRQKSYLKVVLSRTKSLKLSDAIDPTVLLKSLAKIDESSYLFAFSEPSGRTFLGRSPERLLSWDGLLAEVDAIAGTRSCSGEKAGDDLSAQDLKSSKKDLVEHRFVSDFVEETLKQSNMDIVAVEAESLLRLKHVQHMRSTYRALGSKGFKPLELLSRLHPTPAVGGVPRAEANQTIQHMEPFERGLFTGAVGCFSRHRGDFAIGIRSALLNGSVLKIYAGAGIVERSSPVEEWLETEVKMNNFLEIFGLTAESGEAHD